MKRSVIHLFSWAAVAMLSGALALQPVHAYAFTAAAVQPQGSSAATYVSGAEGNGEQDVAQDSKAATNARGTTEAQDENDAYRYSSAVKAMGRMLGMQPEMAAKVFEILNFLVLGALVVWFLARALPKAFGGRTERIQKQLVEARRATQEATQRLANVEKRLARLDEEIAAIGAQSEQASLQDEARIRAAVEEDKKKIIASAEQEIAAATTNAQRQIRQFAAELAIDQAARRISINAETDRLLVQSFAGRLIGDDKAGQN